MTNTQTDIQTFRLIERIGPEGRFFENLNKQENINTVLLLRLKPAGVLVYQLCLLGIWPVCHWSGQPGLDTRIQGPRDSRDTVA